MMISLFSVSAYTATASTLNGKCDLIGWFSDLFPNSPLAALIGCNSAPQPTSALTLLLHELLGASVGNNIAKRVRREAPQEESRPWRVGARFRRGNGVPSVCGNNLFGHSHLRHTSFPSLGNCFSPLFFFFAPPGTICSITWWKSGGLPHCGLHRSVWLAVVLLWNQVMWWVWDCGGVCSVCVGLRAGYRPRTSLACAGAVSIRAGFLYLLWHRSAFSACQ